VKVPAKYILPDAVECGETHPPFSVIALPINVVLTPTPLNPDVVKLGAERIGDIKLKLSLALAD
jgi:hypothetical protein